MWKPAGECGLATGEPQELVELQTATEAPLMQRKVGGHDARADQRAASARSPRPVHLQSRPQRHALGETEAKAKTMSKRGIDDSRYFRRF
jgi:hypothetical protein